MTQTPFPAVEQPLVLRAQTAADLMTPNPVSIAETAVVQEAISLLIDKGFSAAPVIDEAGRPVGVLSRTDILVHDRERAGALFPLHEADERQARRGRHPRDGFQEFDIDGTRVREIMTPAVLSVSPTTPVRDVVSQLLRLNVHRLFVVDDNDVLIGVISAQDILRRLVP
jgi:CBS domain-containing protein